MKGTLLIVAVTFAAGVATGKLLYSQPLAQSVDQSVSGIIAGPQIPEEYLAPVEMPNSQPVTFRCDGRQHCSEMSSRAEAYYFLQHCPDTKMDGDADGRPCEQQFP